MELKKKISDLFFILLGNTCFALGIVMFVLPSGIIAGGTTGISISVEHFFNIPISVFVFFFNLVMFITGAVFMGKKFAFTTLISTFYYPLILGVLQKEPTLSGFTDDTMLATVCGGIITGFSVGMVLRAGASTGGMDIPPLILKKKFGLPVSVTLCCFDFAILLSQAIFSDKEQILYGVLFVLLTSVTLDRMLMSGTTQTQVKIMSRKYEQINEAVNKTIDRGTTLIHSTTGYMRIENPMVLTIVSNRELNALTKLVMGIDPDAFMVINRVNEVRGRGFTGKKK